MNGGVASRALTCVMGRGEGGANGAAWRRQRASCKAAAVLPVGAASRAAHPGAPGCPWARRRRRGPAPHGGAAAAGGCPMGAGAAANRRMNAIKTNHPKDAVGPKADGAERRNSNMKTNGATKSSAVVVGAAAAGGGATVADRPLPSAPAASA
ncbi:Uncharacterized protein GBIM_01849 [Gryllus bimaculatus]|nr:Uncharacterized protein GBIM_01849 [Gryllus bimaculatus]